MSDLRRPYRTVNTPRPLRRRHPALFTIYTLKIKDHRTSIQVTSVRKHIPTRTKTHAKSHRTRTICDLPFGTELALPTRLACHQVGVRADASDSPCGGRSYQVRELVFRRVLLESRTMRLREIERRNGYMVASKGHPAKWEGSAPPLRDAFSMDEPAGQSPT